MRLNVKQEDALAEVAGAKAEFDRQVEVLKAEYYADVDLLRGSVREAARAAVESGVPLRQIGFALETSDHKTIRAYTEEV